MQFLLQGFEALKWQQVVMWAIGALLIYLAIAKDMEPALLLPMGFGAILVNLPLSPVIGKPFSYEVFQELFNEAMQGSTLNVELLFKNIEKFFEGAELSKDFTLAFLTETVGSATAPTHAMYDTIVAVKLTSYCIAKATEWKKSREEQNDENNAS